MRNLRARGPLPGHQRGPNPLVGIQAIAYDVVVVAQAGAERPEIGLAATHLGDRDFLESARYARRVRDDLIEGDAVRDASE